MERLFVPVCSVLGLPVALVHVLCGFSARAVWTPLSLSLSVCLSVLIHTTTLFFVLFCFLRRHFMLFFPLYATVIALVIIV